MKTMASALCGFVFSLGLIISGMADPANVLGFLDVTGTWNPLLAFIMGAIEFGVVGWGLTGVCPGPALVLLGLDGWKAWLLVVSIVLGWKGTQYLQNSHMR